MLRKMHYFEKSSVNNAPLKAIKLIVIFAMVILEDLIPIQVPIAIAIKYLFPNSLLKILSKCTTLIFTQVFMRLTLMISL